MNSLRPLLIVVSIVVLLFCTSSVQAQVSGPIGSDTTWTAASSPILVSGIVTIPAGKTLTVEAGTEVRFASGTGLVVEGTLVAQGNAVDTIAFTSSAGSPARGDWNGIEFANTANVGSVFEYVKVEYVGGGASQAGIFYRTGAYGVALINIRVRESSSEGVNLRASSPSIRGSLFEDVDGFGVFSDLFSNFSLEVSTVRNCLTGGVRVPLNAAPVIDSCTIENNGDGIYVDIGASPAITANLIQNNINGIYYRSVGITQPNLRDNTIQGSAQYGIQHDGSSNLNARYNYWGSDYGPYNESNNPTGRGDSVSNKVLISPWKPSGLLSVTNITSSIVSNTTWSAGVYWVKNNITVNGGVSLTLDPGVIVKFAPNTNLTVNGTLAVQGTTDSLVVFTSEKDDSYGGDTNGDSEATQPSASDWSYVRVNGPLSVSNLIVKYAGSGLSLYTSATLDSVFASSNGTGLDVNSGTSLTITNSVFGGNNSHGVNVGGANGYVLSVANSKFVGNGGYGLYLGDGTISSFTGSKAAFNASIGVRGYQANAALASVISGNEFSNNGQHGLWYGSARGSAITVSQNLFEGNVQDGLVTTKASIQDNQFTSNRLGIVLMGDVTSTYSGNVFTGNTHNNALGLRSDDSHLKGTLTMATPSGFVPGVYLAFTSEMGASDTLVVEPGVVVKMRSGTHWNVYGLLDMQGTVPSPITFTSYRDHSVGGNINAITDTTTAKRGDWNYLRFLGTQRTVVQHVDLRYSSTGFWVNASSWLNTISYLTAMHGSSSGASFDNAPSVTVEYSKFNFNQLGLSAYGIEVILRNSEFNDNTTYGMTSNTGPGPKEISASFFERNGSRGLDVVNVTGPLTMVGNTINANGDAGVSYLNTTSPRTDVQFIGNIVTNNGQEGIMTSRSRFVDNTITGNRYPIGYTGRMGYSFTDNTGVDGNVISGNTNRVISIRENVGDTLQYLFPAALPTHTYLVISSRGDYGTTPLIMEPGVIVKFDNGAYFTRTYRVVAIGTEAQPIIWTSWRDSTYGGKTNAASDTLGPQPGNWNYVRMVGATDAQHSRFEHIEQRFGNYPFYFSSVGLLNPIKHVHATRNTGYAFYFDGTSTAVLDSVTADSSSSTGIGMSSGSMIVRNSFVRGNGTYGLYASSAGEFSEVTNTTISGSQHGIYVDGANAPQVFQGNLIENNSLHGVFATAANAGVDTLLMFNGNTFKGNGTGLMSSRAYIVDNVFQQNTYPLGLTKEISLTATGNSEGNFYFGNSFQNNQYDVIRLYDDIYGVVGGTFPDSLSNKVYAFSSTLSVPASGQLWFRPGTIVKVSGGAIINVSGIIHAEGTNAERVIVTSWKDDTYGGDSNEDSSSTLPAVGDMGYIRLLNSTASTVHTFKSVNVRYSSYSIYIDQVNQVTIDSSLFANNTYGMYRTGSAGTTTVSSSEFRDNNYGLYNGVGGSVTISTTNFSNHATAAIHQAFNSTINAANNYWGAATGPLVTNGPDLNPGGTGDKINVPTGTVIYRPFYTGRSGVLAGDVSQNGQISAFDASLVLQHVVASITLDGLQQAAADVTADGSVSALDASLILRYVVGYISGFRTLGSPAAKMMTVPTYVSLTSPTSDPSEFDLAVRVRGDGIFATQMTVEFDEASWSIVSVSKTAMSDGFMLAEGRAAGRLKVAMAGSVAAAGEGDWVVTRFRALTKGASTEVIRVSQFDFNEPNRTTAAEEDMNVIPSTFALGQNYPNPFNPSTIIRYDVPRSSTVSLKVYDMLGRIVATLVDGVTEAGSFSVTWNGASSSGARVSSGIYFAAMTARAHDGQEFRSVRKMLLAK